MGDITEEEGGCEQQGDPELHLGPLPIPLRLSPLTPSSGEDAEVRWERGLVRPQEGLNSHL